MTGATVALICSSSIDWKLEYHHRRLLVFMTELTAKKFAEEIKKPLEGEGYEVQKALGKGAFG